ncbi:methyltransferase domain-containing protein [Sorangium sp. So ce295]|uniref:class I SAM-dependent methyltransferase n=1 Tax=Sorangium sp. So ce295 TaxID=3133295 RepID=UPI003F63358E
MTDRAQRVTEFYEFLWPFLAEIAEGDAAAWLDADPGGRPYSEYLPEIPERQGVGKGDTLLDLGCGKGRLTVEFVKKLGCRVIAVDPLEQNITLAAERFRNEGVQDSVTLLRGAAEAIPLPDASVDFIWCRDVFNHIDDIEQSAAECARVLRPGKRMMNYSVLATPNLEPGEIPRFAEPLGLNVDTLSEDRMMTAFKRAGLRVVEYGTTNIETSPYYEALGEDSGRDAMRLARALRARSRTIARLGERNYACLLGYYYWNLNLLIDKLTYGVWILEREQP